MFAFFQKKEKRPKIFLVTKTMQQVAKRVTTTEYPIEIVVRSRADRCKLHSGFQIGTTVQLSVGIS